MRILVGSCGGLTGLYLVKTLRRMNEKFELYGFDTVFEIPTKFFLDKFYIITRATEEDRFIEQLINLLCSEQIDIYIPVHSEECRVISKHQDVIRRSTMTKFMISPYETFKDLDDKEKAYENLKALGITTPKVYKSLEEIDKFPVVFKPKLGSGSRRLFLVESLEEAELLARKYEDVILVEYLEGKEYTVDLFFDSKGKLITYNQRIRIKTLGGAAIITRNDFSIDVKNEIEKISHAYRIVGPANFQFFHTNDGKVIFTDINLRFASGGLPLTVESGANIVELLLLELNGKPYDPSNYQSDRKKRIMYRYFEECFEVQE